MANNNVLASATGDYTIGIDSDNDSTAQRFRVEKHNGATPVLLFEVNESGHVGLMGELRTFSDSPVKVSVHADNTTGPLLQVKKGATTPEVMAQIESNGKGNFSTGGVRTKVLTSSSAPLTGDEGDIFLNSADNKLWVHVNGYWRVVSTTLDWW